VLFRSSFPKKWKLLPLDACAYVQTGATKGKRFSDNEAIEVPYLRVANVQDGYLDLSEMKSIRIKKSELNRFSLKKGDVVVTEGGDFDKLGRGSIWQGEIPVCVHQNHIFAVRPKPEIVLPEYLAFLIQSEYGKKYFVAVAHRTTHLACINSTKLKALPVIIPTLSE
jgi:type I restriction enzyme S subunit